MGFLPVKGGRGRVTSPQRITAALTVEGQSRAGSLPMIQSFRYCQGWI